MKKRTKIFISISIVIFICIILITFFSLGLSIKQIQVDIRSVNASSLKDSQEYYERLIINENYSSEQLIRKANPYPTDDVTAYREIYLKINVMNYSLFDNEIYDAWLISNLSDDSNVIMKNGSPVTQKVGALNQENNVYIAHIFFFAENMTDDEIENYLSNLTFKLTTSRASKTFNLKKADFLYENKQ